MDEMLEGEEFSPASQCSSKGEFHDPIPVCHRYRRSRSIDPR